MPVPMLAAEFTPCQGKTACRDNGERCLTCNRSMDEIVRLRQLLDGLSTLALDYGYSNVDDYAAYIAKKLPKMINHRLAQAEEANGINQ